MTRRQPLRRSQVTYYPCRAPNQHFVLLAECQDNTLGQRLDQLEQARKAFMESVDLPYAKHCTLERCMRRQCARFNFLPYASDEFQDSGHFFYELKMDCLDYGKMLYAPDIVSGYYFGLTTTYRLTISMIMLVDWLIRMKIVVKLTLNNLIIDPETSFVTLLDWSAANAVEVFPAKLRVIYYRRAADMILRLANVERRDDEWILPYAQRDNVTRRFFNILLRLKNQRYELPEELGEAIDYVCDLAKEQENTLNRVLNVLQDVQVAVDEPLYRIYRKSEK